jgi:high affinity choline transporter 7
VSQLNRREPQAALSVPKGAIRNPQSAICNPQYHSLHTVSSHVDFVGVLFVVWGLLTTLVGVSTLALGVGAVALITSASHGGGGGAFAAGVTAAFFTTLAIIAIVWGSAHVVVGVPLRRRRPWARIIALMLGSVDLLLLPYGTALGVYALYVLLNEKGSDGTAADLIVAGRQMPLWVAALTMTATWVDGGYLLGTTEGAYKSSIQLGIQGGLCFGISLIVGGAFFAGVMRRFGFTTLIDPFEARFGQRWAAVLFLPALAGELFWSAELLVAIGSTFGVLLGMPLATAILLSAVVTTAYTVLGGMWSVAYTDIFQLGLVALGLAAALPYVLDGAGGLLHAWSTYAAARPDGSGLVPRPHPNGGLWTTASIVGWWDVSLMLIFGGIPWNCYFQRVLSCRTPRDARGQSILAGTLTIAFTVPPLLMGVAAFAYPWPTDILSRLQAQPADAMPMLFANAVPPVIGLLGLAAIIGAVTSSFSSSILSAGSMLSWNCFKRLVWPSLSVVQMSRVVRSSILLFGAIATVLALKVRSVQALWFFSSDLVFVLLFPQLLWALFDTKANRTGSIVAFAVSAVLRIGGGEPLLGLPALIAYPENLPFRTLAAVASLVLLPLVSRATARWDAPVPLRNVAVAELR